MYYRHSITIDFHVDDFLVTGNLDEQETAFWELSKFRHISASLTSKAVVTCSFKCRPTWMNCNDFEMTECKPLKRLPYVPDASATSTQQLTTDLDMLLLLVLPHTWLR